MHEAGLAGDTGTLLTVGGVRSRVVSAEGDTVVRALAPGSALRGGMVVGTADFFSCSVPVGPRGYPVRFVRSDGAPWSAALAPRLSVFRVR